MLMQLAAGHKPQLFVQGLAGRGGVQHDVALAELFQPDVFIPCHHDQILGLGNTSLIPGGFVLPDMATEPLRLEIRNSMPETRAITPIYRTPILVDMKSGHVSVG